MTRGPEEPEGREETPLSCARASLCRRDTGKKDKNVRGARWEGGKGGEAFFCLFPLPIIPRALCLLPLYASSTFPTMHLICPLRFYISIVFNFSWDGFNIHEKGKTKIMRFFGGAGDANKVHYGKCGSGVLLFLLGTQREEKEGTLRR